MLDFLLVANALVQRTIIFEDELAVTDLDFLALFLALALFGSLIARLLAAIAAGDRFELLLLVRLVLSLVNVRRGDAGRPHVFGTDHFAGSGLLHLLLGEAQGGLDDLFLGLERLERLERGRRHGPRSKPMMEIGQPAARGARRAAAGTASRRGRAANAGAARGRARSAGVGGRPDRGAAAKVGHRRARRSSRRQSRCLGRQRRHSGTAFGFRLGRFRGRWFSRLGDRRLGGGRGWRSHDCRFGDDRLDVGRRFFMFRCAGTNGRLGSAQRRNCFAFRTYDRRDRLGSGGRCRGRVMRALLDQHFQLVTLLRLQAAELVLDIKPRLFAQVEQVLAVDLQSPRQSVDPNFLFLQAALLTGPSRIATFPRTNPPLPGGQGPSSHNHSLFYDLPKYIEKWLLRENHYTLNPPLDAARALPSA